ncbi:AraC family transcriptional regulator [Actinoplanes sp. SE50]|uniref:GlxA family transcriptional regulator n=1 Tax=unclassified Actinoplanes TaxID=2626549 RepID=UPI00023ECF31|nr:MULTISPECIES: helix-turn-helix domain-containing protein [unclassified Actinoplanes]AEV87208.1 HTH-type transcriptional regulator glxA [Actinoplanes sp. SE50/110]ATO85609.1 AraC family transcriptional regulator [Actinoplanes sp. SE50]SLM03022.1 AraC family transcriptional regulator [Actinoplanes sp. SE50/110]
MLFLVVAYDGSELLDIACVTSALAIANRIGADPPYRTVLATPGGRPVACDSGLRLDAGAELERINEPLDTLLVTGGNGHEQAAASPIVVGHVRRLAPLARRIASVCTGSTVLAAAGLLTGRRATTHWRYAAELAARYPDVLVDAEPVWIRDGRVATSGGVTSALDLTLAFIEEDHGPTIARGVALGTVAYLQRPGGQAQISMFLARRGADDFVCRRATDHVAGHLTDDLSSGALARRFGVSERHLTRLFQAYVQLTPAQYVRRARTEAAAHLLGSTGLPMAAVARRCGFGSTESLRQAFLDRYGMPPSRYRTRRPARLRPLADLPSPG